MCLDEGSDWELPKANFAGRSFCAKGRLKWLRRPGGRGPRRQAGKGEWAPVTRESKRTLLVNRPGSRVESEVKVRANGPVLGLDRMIRSKGGTGGAE